MVIREHTLRSSLKEQMQTALQAAQHGQTGLVDMSNQSHNIIADILYEFVYTDQATVTSPTYIQIQYGDKSQGKPFPLQCLPRRGLLPGAPVRRVQPLRIALISMRHLRMDYQVDMAWLLNKDVPSERSLAEVDAFCYQQTRAQLQEALKDGPLKLHLYQTGFQPAVVGFYRALVEELLQRTQTPSVLEVTPYYFSRLMDCYWAGKIWN